MDIILKEDIVGLGYKNDIVTVKNGYGRNYLIPKGKGIIASKSARKVLAENLRQQAGKLAALQAEAEKRAQALGDAPVEIAAKVSINGHLYGSVTAAMVAEELSKRGVEIDRKIVTMRDARKVGEYEAVVHFHKAVEVKVIVKVVAEDAPAAEKAEEAPKPEEASSTPQVAAAGGEEAPTAE